jgi:TIR domain
LHYEFIDWSNRHQEAEAARARLEFKKIGIVPHPSPRPKGINIFISYRRSDSNQAAGRIFDLLKERYGEDQIFFDVDSIPIGVHFAEHISKTLILCAAVLAVIGNTWINPSWRKSRFSLFRRTPPEDFVETELRLESGIPVIPILIDGAVMPRRSQLPATIADIVTLNAAQVRAGRDFHKDMTEVLNLIEPLRNLGAEVQRRSAPRPLYAHT